MDAVHDSNLLLNFSLVVVVLLLVVMVVVVVGSASSGVTKNLRLSQLQITRRSGIDAIETDRESWRDLSDFLEIRKTLNKKRKKWCS